MDLLVLSVTMFPNILLLIQIVDVFVVANLKKLGTYAGNDTIVAFARLHKVHVVIHQLNSPCWEVRCSITSVRLF